MTQKARYSRLAIITVALATQFLGCKPPVTGQNVMPDNPNLSSADQRKAMVQWHQQHDKQSTGGTPQSGQ